MDKEEYGAWLKSLKVGDRVCIKEDMNPLYATKSIVSISLVDSLNLEDGETDSKMEEIRVVGI